MSTKIVACKYKSASHAYEAAKQRSISHNEIVNIVVDDEERREIVEIDDEDRDAHVDLDDVYEMWGTVHTDDGGEEWRVHLVAQ